MKCAALGCARQGAPTFCSPCRRKLPRDLTAASRVRDAVVYLGRKDGYLADHSPKVHIEHDNPGGVHPG